MNEAAAAPTRFGMYSRANLAKTRMKKDIHELATQRFHVPGVSTAIEFPLGNQDLHQLSVRVALDTGLYAGGVFWFALEVPSNYPFHPPAVQCLTRAWHPSVDPSTGKVALRVLERSEWRPVLSINSVVFALQLLFVEPNPLPEHTANFIAASTLQNNAAEFADQVQQTLDGGTFLGLTFPPNNEDAHRDSAGSSSASHSGAQSLSSECGATAKRKSSSLEEILETAMRFDHSGNDFIGEAASSAACDESEDEGCGNDSSSSSFSELATRGAPQLKRSCCPPPHSPAPAFGNTATFNANTAPNLSASSVSSFSGATSQAATSPWQLTSYNLNVDASNMGYPGTVGGEKPCPTLPRGSFPVGGAFRAHSDSTTAVPLHMPAAGTAGTGSQFSNATPPLTPLSSSSDTRWLGEMQEQHGLRGAFPGGNIAASPSGGMPCGLVPKSPTSAFSGYPALHPATSCHLSPSIAASPPAASQANPAPWGC